MSPPFDNPYASPAVQANAALAPAANVGSAVFAYTVVCVDIFACAVIVYAASHTLVIQGQWTPFDVLSAASLIAPALLALVCNALVLFSPRLGPRMGRFAATLSLVMAFVTGGLAFAEHYVRRMAITKGFIYGVVGVTLLRVFWNALYLLALARLDRYRAAVTQHDEHALTS